jgi:hypothetical protein
MILAIYQNERVYEGNYNFLTAAYPPPSLTTVVCNRPGQKPPLFREDSFDPTVRLRRGRFYMLDTQNAEYRVDRVAHGPYAVPRMSLDPILGMDRYRPWQPHEPLSDPDQPYLMLGDAAAQSAWRILDKERLFNSETLVTLKMVNPLAVLPELRLHAIPADRRDQIASAREKTIDAALRYLPVPVVDVCREFARIILSAWLPTVGRSGAGDLAEQFRRVPDDKPELRSAGFIINRFHSTSKSSEQERQSAKGRELREISEADADLAVSLVGLLLREIGWAA